MHTALLALCLVRALLLGGISSAHAADQRDLDGHAVDLSAAPHVVVFFSMRDAAELAGVQTLQAAGADVVLVNTDSASERSMIRPFLAARGVVAPVLADPTRDLATRLQVPGSSGWLVLDARGDEVLRQLGGTPDLTRLAQAARDCAAAMNSVATH